MPESEPTRVDALRRSVDSLTGELLVAYEELALLHSLTAQIGRLREEDQIAAVALNEAVEILRADCGWIVFWDAEGPRVPAGCRRQIEADTVELVNRQVLEPLQLRGKSQSLSHSLAEDYALGNGNAPARFLASALGEPAAFLGHLCVGRRPGGKIFTSADQKLISAVASLTAVELENLRLQRAELEKARLENELELARGVQRCLLPSSFAGLSFLEAQGVSLPCYEVGGDYFDCLPLGPAQCLLIMADVSGKGPAAALQAAMLQGVVHAAARQKPELPRLMSTINECLLARTVEGSFASAFLAVLDSAGRLRYSNGGHDPPLWIDRRGRVRQLTAGGTLLGFLPDAVYQQGEVRLAPGDLLLLYTDGVTEAQDERGEPFGVLRILDWAGRQAERSPAEVKADLIRVVTQFCAGRPPADDLTLLAVKYLGSPGECNVAQALHVQATSDS